MTSLLRAIRDRLLPAVLTAAGVTLIGAGVLSYTGSAAGHGSSTVASPAPTGASADPGASFGFPSLPPIDATAPPSVAPPSADPKRVATRIVIEALGIDLPVIRPRGNSSTYPACDVAMYIQELSQPGNGRATYIYAHARDGMFGPIYERAILKRSGGPKSMVGMVVQVYTSDNYVHEYAIKEVRLHQLDLNDAVAATTEQLWLQTSEGPKGTPGKTQILALPLIVLPADPAAAHPKARPVACD